MRIPQFEAFRRQYPAASLTSDLLAIHENYYVVRGQVYVEGRLLSSAMAADHSLETAEDRAYQRAIENLLERPAAAEPAESIVVPASSAPALTADTTPAIAPAPAPAARPLPLEQIDPAHPPKRSSEEALAPASEPPALDLDLLTPLPEAELPRAAAIATDPVDLSDIIAQTDVELRRLGWTTDQGREFLQKTYGKRSRHDLSDQELLEFLLFLETQMPLIGR